MQVARDGERREVAVDEVVTDDVIELTQGTQIVADGTVLTSDALEVDESLLSGESVPLDKGPDTRVLSGSFVTAGRGWYRADKVGGPTATPTRSRPRPGASRWCGPSCGRARTASSAW